jgi:hypothetical protein
MAHGINREVPTVTPATQDAYRDAWTRLAITKIVLLQSTPLRTLSPRALRDLLRWAEPPRLVRYIGRAEKRFVWRWQRRQGLVSDRGLMAQYHCPLGRCVCHPRKVPDAKKPTAPRGLWASYSKENLIPHSRNVIFSYPSCCHRA